MPFSSDSTVATLNARLDKLMPVSADFGPLASVLSRAGSAKPGDRYTAMEIGRALMQAAENLPRPAPLPIVGSSIFADNTAGLRRPSDPTGPVTRPLATTAVAEPDAATNAAAGGDTALVTATWPAAGAAAASATAVLTPTAPSFTPPPPPSGESPAGDESSSGGMARPALYDEEVIDPPRRRRWRWVLAVLVLLVALAAGALIALRVTADKSYAVPQLAGVTEAVGRNQVAGHDWQIVVQRERNDDQPQNSIIRTEPPAGTKIKTGGTIVFVVSDGLTLSTLPNVTGQTLDQATATVADSNLDLVVGEEVFDEVIPAGTVISWMVPAQPGLTEGMEVMQRTVVSVVVSKGPAPRQVPQLIGLDPAAAQAAVEGLQLVFVRDVDRFSPDVPAGLVMDQSLPPGTEIARGDTVIVAVSMGPDLVVMPSLEGQTFEQIKATLAAAGLAVGEVTGPTDGSGFLVSVTVDGRDVQVGEMLLRGTALDFEYF